MAYRSSAPFDKKQQRCECDSPNTLQIKHSETLQSEYANDNFSLRHSLAQHLLACDVTAPQWRHRRIDAGLTSLLKRLSILCIYSSNRAAEAVNS